MSSRFYYNLETDDLILSNKAENEKVKKNFILDDFIISLTGSGKIIGLEIKNFSIFLEEAGINSEILKDIKSMELIVVSKKQFLAIYVSLEIPQKTDIITRRLPITHLPLEVVCN